MDIAVECYNENNGHDYDDRDAGGGDDSNDDDVGCLSFLCLLSGPWALLLRLRRWTG